MQNGRIYESDADWMPVGRRGLLNRAWLDINDHMQVFAGFNFGDGWYGFIARFFRQFLLRYI